MKIFKALHISILLVAMTTRLKEGYVDIDDILALPESGSRTVQDIDNIVRRDNKGRFQTRIYNGKKQIKATQGHTIKLSDPGLKEITSSREVRVVLHGTHSSKWDAIKMSGLSRMRRQHIHFAEGESGVQSGFPPGCDMAVEIDLQRALAGGIKFYQSENGVILSEGNHAGCIPKEYFRQAYKLGSRENLPFR